MEDMNTMNTQLNEMVLRAARPTDETVLRRLAALDSTRPLRGRALVAEVDGEPVAAISLADGRVVADPFRRTADVVELLRVRQRRLAPTPAPTKAEHAHGLLHRLRHATAA